MVNRNLSSVVDLLTVEIERRDDDRLRKARELVLDVAIPQPTPRRISFIARFFGRKAAA